MQFLKANFVMFMKDISFVTRNIFCLFLFITELRGKCIYLQYFVCFLNNFTSLFLNCHIHIKTDAIFGEYVLIIFIIF